MVKHAFPHCTHRKASCGTHCAESHCTLPAILQNLGVFPGFPGRTLGGSSEPTRPADFHQHSRGFGSPSSHFRWQPGEPGSHIVPGRRDWDTPPYTNDDATFRVFQRCLERW